MVNCRDLLREISSYMDDEIDDALRKDLEVHLLTCRTCRLLLDSTRKTLRVVADSASFELPVAEERVEELLEWLRRNKDDGEAA